MNIDQFADRVYRDRLEAFSRKGYAHLDPDVECATRVVSVINMTRWTLAPVVSGPGNSWLTKPETFLESRDMESLTNGSSTER